LEHRNWNLSVKNIRGKYNPHNPFLSLTKILTAMATAKKTAIPQYAFQSSSFSPNDPWDAIKGQ
jgi:hypothetical protein